MTYMVFDPHPMWKWEIPSMSRRQGWGNAGNEVPKEDRTPEAARAMRQTWRDRGLTDITITEYHAANTAWSLDRIKEDSIHSKVRWLKAMERTPMLFSRNARDRGHAGPPDSPWADWGTLGRGTREGEPLVEGPNVENPTADATESAQDLDQSHHGTEVGEPEENHQEQMLLEELQHAHWDPSSSPGQWDHDNQEWETPRSHATQGAAQETTRDEWDMLWEFEEAQGPPRDQPVHKLTRKCPPGHISVGIPAIIATL
eukprot:gene25446-31078_t